MAAKNPPKFQFALITEDALQMLRDSDTKSTVKYLMEVKDMYDTINNTVDSNLEAKVRCLRLDKLDQLIEEKVLEVLNRQRPTQKKHTGPRTLFKSNVSEISTQSAHDIGHKPKDSRNKQSKKNIKKVKPLAADNAPRKAAKSIPKGHKNDTNTKSHVLKTEMGNDAILNIASRYFKDLDDRLKGKQ